MTKALKIDEPAEQNERRTQAERTALSDQKMFEAAVILINQHGTQGTTLKAIGEQAGYSRGLANSRFGSKDAFISELFRRFDKRWKKHLRSYTDGLDGVDAFVAAIHALRDFMRIERVYLRAMYILWYESLGKNSDVRVRLAENHASYRKDATGWIASGIKKGEIDPKIDAEQFAVQYCSFIFGIVYQWLVDAEALDLDAVFAHYEKSARKVLSP